MGKGKGGTDDAKSQCLCDGGGLEKNMKASRRLPIPRIPPSDDESIRETVSLTERFRSPEDNVGAKSLAEHEKPKEIKTN